MLTSFLCGSASSINRVRGSVNMFSNVCVLN
uniref:Uncharacterized protein n=1 Tax=Anguilla anguilla TaxID=7936 RepID=A0A0E9TWS2_ANGAN